MKLPAEGAGRPPVSVVASLLVVEDDPDFRRMVVDYLGGRGFDVHGVASRRAALECLERVGVSLVVLDLRLGSDDGLDVLRELKRRGDTPVILMSGHRRDQVDRIVGLELGADDYLTKPFALRELLARVNAVLRRSDLSPEGAAAARPRLMRFAGWQLNCRLRVLTNPGGDQVPLTKSEFALLVAFLEAPRRPLSREDLLQASRMHEDVFERSIDVQVLRLRRKLEADPSSPALIVTERGVGYVFAASVEVLR